MNKLLLLPLMIILNYSCEKIDNNVDITSQCSFLEYNFGPCYSLFTDTVNTEIIIRDTNTYRSVFIENNPTYYNCDTASLPIINFNKYSLIGILTIGSGCSVNYERKILNDKTNKKIIYSISFEYLGICEMLLTSWNLVLVPRISDEYTVEFQLK